MTCRQYLLKTKLIDKKIQSLENAKKKLRVRYVKSNIDVAYKNYKAGIVQGKVATKKRFKKASIETIEGFIK